MKKTKQILFFVMSAVFLTVFAVFCGGKEPKTKTDTQIGFQRSDGKKTNQPTSFTWISNSKNNPVTIYVAKGDDNPAANKIEASDYPAGIEVHSDECGTVSPNSTCTLYFDVDTTLVGQSPTFTIKGTNTNTLSVTVDIVKARITSKQTQVSISPGENQTITVNNLDNVQIPNIVSQFTTYGQEQTCLSSKFGENCLNGFIQPNGNCDIIVSAESSTVCQTSVQYEIAISAGNGTNQITIPINIYDSQFCYQFDIKDSSTYPTAPDTTCSPSIDKQNLYYYGTYIVEVQNHGKSKINGFNIKKSKYVEPIVLTRGLDCTKIYELETEQSCFIQFSVKEDASKTGEFIKINTANAGTATTNFELDDIQLNQNPPVYNDIAITAGSQQGQEFSITNETNINFSDTVFSLTLSDSDNWTPSLSSACNDFLENNPPNCSFTLKANSESQGASSDLSLSTDPALKHLLFSNWSVKSVKNEIRFMLADNYHNAKIQQDASLIVHNFSQGNPLINIEANQLSGTQPSVNIFSPVLITTELDGCINFDPSGCLSNSILDETNTLCTISASLNENSKCYNKKIEYEIRSDSSNSLYMTFVTSGQYFSTQHSGPCDKKDNDSVKVTNDSGSRISLNSCSQEIWVVDNVSSESTPCIDINDLALDKSYIISGDHCTCPSASCDTECKDTDTCGSKPCALIFNSALSLFINNLSPGICTTNISVQMHLLEEPEIQLSTSIPVNRIAPRISVDIPEILRKREGSDESIHLFRVLKNEKIPLPIQNISDDSLNIGISNPDSCLDILDASSQSVGSNINISAGETVNVFITENSDAECSKEHPASLTLTATPSENKLFKFYFENAKISTLNINGESWNTLKNLDVYNSGNFEKKTYQVQLGFEKFVEGAGNTYCSDDPLNIVSLNADDNVVADVLTFTGVQCPPGRSNQMLFMINMNTKWTEDGNTPDTLKISQKAPNKDVIKFDDLRTPQLQISGYKTDVLDFTGKFRYVSGSGSQYRAVLMIPAPPSLRIKFGVTKSLPSGSVSGCALGCKSEAAMVKIPYSEEELPVNKWVDFNCDTRRINGHNDCLEYKVKAASPFPRCCTGSVYFTFDCLECDLFHHKTDVTVCYKDDGCGGTTHKKFGIPH